MSSRDNDDDDDDAIAIVDAHVASGALTRAHGALLRGAIALDQAHIVRAWPAPGVDDDAKRAFAEQLSAVDAGYPGGIGKYIANARGLLEASRDGKNPFEGWTPSVPAGKVVK